MQGFYANLLTKNISMGGDIERNSVSAYTAGSKRQRGMEEQGGAIKDARAEPAPAAPATPAAAPAPTLAGTPASNVQIARERYLAAKAGAPAPAEAPPSSSALAIQSARERYLARKHSASKEST